jgi:hypothetical protein
MRDLTQATAFAPVADPQYQLRADKTESCPKRSFFTRKTLLLPTP